MTGGVRLDCAWLVGGRQPAAAIGLLLAVCVAGLAGCSKGKRLTLTPVATGPVEIRPVKIVPPSAVLFVDATRDAGVSFKYEHDGEKDRRGILETLGGGVGMVDFDGDGLLDLCYTGGGRYGEGLDQPRGLPPACFRNRGDFQFENVTDATGLATPSFYSHGVHAADYDRDGFADLLITGYGGLQLWHNQGDGTFREIPAGSGLESGKLWNASAAWADFNGDGELDLFVATYVDWSPTNDPHCPSLENRSRREICYPRMFEPLPDEIFLSNGDGTFRPSAGECGILLGNGLGVVAFDADNDGDIDLYVANDSEKNFFYLNDGRGIFKEVATLHGCAVSAGGSAEGSMGVDLLDFNHDGLADILVDNFQDEYFALYRNEGNAKFLHDSQSAGLVDVGDQQVAFGLQTADFDQDGDEDVFVTNGHPLLFPRILPKRQRPQLLEWNEAFQIANTLASPYLQEPHEGRGIACGDLDGDGDLDVSVSHMNEPVVVLRTDLAAANHFLCVRLIGTQSPRIPFGARLVLHTSQGDRLRHLRGGGGYLSTAPFDIHWGIPEGASADRLTVHWPSGQVQEIAIESLDERLTIVEPPAAAIRP